jgi:hypothetical protein
MRTYRDGSYMRFLLLTSALFTLLVTGACASSAGAAVGRPAWSIHMLAEPTDFAPDDSTGADGYKIYVTNVGSQPTDGTPVTITDTLPPGLTITEPITYEIAAVTGEEYMDHYSQENGRVQCTKSPVQCTYSGVIPAGDVMEMEVRVATGSSVQGSVTNAVTVTGGGLAASSLGIENEVTPTVAGFGITDFNFGVTGLDGTPDAQAGGHPYAVATVLDFNTELDQEYFKEENAEFYQPSENAKDVVVDLPLGFVGNPQSAPKCPIDELIRTGFNQYHCPKNTVIGEVTVRSTLGKGASSSIAGNGSSVPVSPLYNLVPEHGHAAEFGFNISNVAQVRIYADVVHVSGGYIVRVTTPDIQASGLQVLGQKGFLNGFMLTFFGDPAREDGGSDSSVPFFTNPADCSTNSLATTVHLDTWTKKGAVNPDGTPSFSDPNWLTASSSQPPVTGCNALQFNPTLSLRPDTAEADVPTGATVDLTVPQAPSSDEALATPPLRDTVVTLPQGLALSPSAANGLQACSEAQLGFEDGEVNTSEPTCPEASKVGSVELTTPLLEKPIGGSVYLAEQGNNPFGSLVALYLVIDDPVTGVLLKLPGEVHLDSVTGQVTATFDDNPQLPFSALTLKFKEGPRAPLVTPAGCGTYTTRSSLTPWSAPQSGPPATPSSSFTISSGCTSGFAPALVSGTTINQAGAYSPYTLTLSRQDGEQDLEGLEATLPPGLLAKLAGVPQCGNAEADAGACPAGSRIGSVTVAAGAGPDPVYVHGEIFLTGPYNGGPFGEVVEVPAIAGPFNLGLVVVRGSIRINPTTAQASVVSDPFPTILQGIPLQVKTVDVTLDREGFTFNPTSCESLSTSGTVTSYQGTQIPVSGHFQAANCATLPFKPSFSVSTKAHAEALKDGTGAALDVKVASKGGPGVSGEEANIKRVDVTVPKLLPARLQPTLQNACTEAQFAKNAADCPPDSFVGTATAVTPVLDVPLTGPAIFVSHGGEAFPDLDLVLQGEGVEILLTGRTDIKGDTTYSKFETVPDAPISSFDLSLPEGPHSALASGLPTNDKSLCGQSLEMPTMIEGQNGAVFKQTTKVTIEGCKPALYVRSTKVSGKSVTITVTVPSAGKIVASGSGLSRQAKQSAAEKLMTLKLALSSVQAAKVSKTHELKTEIKLAFTPKKGRKLTKTVMVTFK